MVGVVVLMAGASFGKNDYGDRMADHLGIAAAPKEWCSLCHIVPGEINRPFGFAALDAGVAMRATPIETVLDRIDMRLIDSDGDDVADVAELRLLRDPNRREPPPTADRVVFQRSPSPRMLYGCGSDMISELVGGLVIFVVFTLRRRRHGQNLHS